MNKLKRMPRPNPVVGGARVFTSRMTWMALTSMERRITKTKESSSEKNRAANKMIVNVISSNANFCISSLVR